MPEIQINNDEVVLDLSFVEELGALHGSMRVPRGSVTGAYVAEHPTEELRGMRIGTGIPGMVELGTWFGSFGSDFWAVDKKGAAVVIQLDGQKYKRLIASVPDCDGVVRELGF
jgi:hypothetical protein